MSKDKRSANLERSVTFEAILTCLEDKGESIQQKKRTILGYLPKRPPCPIDDWGGGKPKNNCPILSKY